MGRDDETLKLSFTIDESLQEMLVAELFARGFDAFEQTQDTLDAYAVSKIWSDDLRQLLRNWLVENHVKPDFEVSTIADQNWNEIWEATIQPISVGPFVIKPSWASVTPGYDHIVLEIDPKMSFGTGYHASTRLALRLLPDALIAGNRVLDAGTGTGILSIAAARIGAKSVFAFDNDHWAYQNAQENVDRNNVDHIVTCRLGDINCVSDSVFDVIIANIHLTVIVDMMPFFISKLSSGGRIIVSGLLQSDQARILSLASEFLLTVVREETEDEWYAATLTIQTN